MSLLRELTFAEAYMQMKEKEKARALSRRIEVSYISSMEELVQLMKRIVDHLTQDANVALKTIRVLLQPVPSAYTSNVTKWCDRHHLDILHHSIISNRPDVIQYLLGERKLFPKSHQPSLNPYAHLAATLGFKDCLRVILTWRPDDFFKGTNPQHAIRLPEEMMLRFQLNDGYRSGMPKYMDKLLDKIKSSTDEAEKAAADTTDLGSIYDEVTSIVQKTSASKKKRSRVRIPAVKIVNRKESSKEAPKEPKIESRINGRKISTPLLGEKRSKLDEAMHRKLLETKVPGVIELKKKTGAACKEHKLTIYWDVFSDGPPGVVKGAGKHVKVDYIDHDPDRHININLNLPSFALETSQPKGGKKQLQEHQQQNNIHQRVLRPRVSKLSQTIQRQLPQLQQQQQKDLGVSKNKMDPLLNHVGHESSPDQKDINSKAGFGLIELGVRGKKKYKEFLLKPTERKVSMPVDESYKYLDKTPITLAAERGHIECVQLLLEMVVLKHNPMMVTKEPLTLATKARSPEAILLLLDKRLSRIDYQSAVLLAIRELYPDCLSALLATKNKDREALFDGTNLFHILYTQSLISNCRYEMMPEMTRVLIACKEDPNSHSVPRTFPMYTLISCAFNITTRKKVFYYLECLVILLDSKANPHFNEEKSEKGIPKLGMSFSRQAFSSAVNCVFQCAKNSVNFFESVYWPQVFRKRFITTITTRDQTSRRILNDVLFEYMSCVSALGIDQTILKALLHYGANPDFKKDDKYAINVYFDNLFPYLTHFEVIEFHNKFKTDLDKLMILFRAMNNRCLKEALTQFLDDHLLTTPIQALPICRYFCYLIDQMLRTPKSLVELSAQVVWIKLRRNSKRVSALPLPPETLYLVLP